MSFLTDKRIMKLRFEPPLNKRKTYFSSKTVFDRIARTSN